MRLLFINRVYPPDQGATGQLLQDLAEGLSQTGWSVHVLAGGAAPSARSTNPFSRGAAPATGPVAVHRVAGRSFSHSSHLRRALAYLSLYPRLLLAARRLPPPDVIVTLTDPPLQLVLGPLLRRMRGGRLIHWAQDIYPEVAERMKVIRSGGLLAQFLERLRTGSVCLYDRIVVPGRCMAAHLAALGIAHEKLQVIPNWGFAPAADPEAVADFRRRHRLEGRFVVMYSGNLGWVHHFEWVRETAQHLSTHCPELLFLFVGGGPRLKEIQASSAGFPNVRFLEAQVKEQLPASLAAADVHLATLSPQFCGLVVPSKVYGAFAAGRPCLFLGPRQSEAARVVEEHQLGAVLEEPDAEAIAARLQQWMHQPDTLQEMQTRAIEFADEHSSARAIRQWDQLLRERLSMD